MQFTMTAHRLPVQVKVADSVVNVTAVTAEADGSPRLHYHVTKRGVKRNLSLFVEDPAPVLSPQVAAVEAPEPAPTLMAKTSDSFKRAFDWMMG